MHPDRRRRQLAVCRPPGRGRWPSHTVVSNPAGIPLAVRQVRGTDSDTSWRRTRPQWARADEWARRTRRPGLSTQDRDVAVVNCSCRFPVPFGFRALASVTPRNVHPSCTLVEDHFAVRVLPSLRVPSPSLFLSPVAACLATPLPHPLLLLCSDSRRRQVLLPQGILRPARRAGHTPSRPAGRTRPRGPHPAPRAGSALHRAP